MGTRIIQASVTEGRDVDKLGGQFITFGKINSDSGAVANTRVKSATMYISSYKSYNNLFYLSVIYGGNSDPIVAETNNLAGNSSTHSSTETLKNCTAMLSSAACNSITLGVVSTSGTGPKIQIRTGCTIKLTIEHEPGYSACKAPTAVSVAKNNVAPGESVTLSWSGAAGGTSNAIKAYEVYRATSATGAYTLLTTVSSTAASASCSVTAPTANANSYYYKILTVGTVVGYNSGQSSAYAMLTCSFSAPSAPTSVTLSQPLANPGSNITLSWSAAAAGTNNPIVSYTVYRATSAAGAYTLLGTSTTTSLPVTVNANEGEVYCYKVAATGKYGSLASGQSAAVATLTTNSKPTAPTTATASPAIFESGNITISWSGATDADSNLSKYQVQYATSVDNATWKAWADVTVAATGSSVTHVPTLERSSYVKYQVRAIDALGLASAYKAAGVVRRNSVPATPSISAPVSGGAIYNSRPRLLLTIGQDADGQSQTLAVNGYSASTSGALYTGKKVVLRKSAELTAPGSQTVSVTATDSLGASSAATGRSFSYAAPAFTDSLTAGTTKIKAVHMNELRQMVNSRRAYYGLAAYAWAATITAGATSLAGWKAHVFELRTAIEEVASHVNGWDSASVTHNIPLPAWIEIPINKPTVAVMLQLREVVAML